MKNVLRLCLTLILVFSQGCGPTYPKEKLAESIIKLCQKEYNTQVKSEVFGHTLAIYIPLPSLFDITMHISKEAQDMLQDVIFSASRVVLSTDADIEFYCIIAQDVRLPEVQIIVIKYVDDVKRAFYTDISRDEYFKRTIFDININPQSKKEEKLKEIFARYKITPELEEKVLDEFFRSSPIRLEDFGYWNNKFYVNDITLPEFLAEQISYRVKMKFREGGLLKEFSFKDMETFYKKDEKKAFFDIYFNIETYEILRVLGKEEDKKIVFKNIFIEASDCLYSYKFEDFNSVRIFDKNSLFKLFVSKEDLYAFKRGKLGIESILGGI